MTLYIIYLAVSNCTLYHICEKNSALKHIFLEWMKMATSVESKQLRNDILMICLRVVQFCPDAPFLVSIIITINKCNTYNRYMYSVVEIICCITFSRKRASSQLSVCLPLFLKVL